MMMTAVYGITTCLGNTHVTQAKPAPCHQAAK
jgi:hypothetical protein